MTIITTAFDDLKNTLAFMEDSPLVKQIDSAAVSQLMVNPNTDSVPAGALSSSSSISTASSSSCNSCCVPNTVSTNSGYMSKSTSNPMLLSLVSSTSSISSNIQGPVSPSFNQNTNVMDLFINKKSPADETLSYDNSGYGNNSSNSSLITVVTNNGGINSAVETAAKKYRCAAQVSEATCCWKGKI